VFTFFIIRGFLLARSLHRNPSVSRFVINRFLRLVPGILCCALFTTMILGPLCSSLDFLQYFANPGWIHYILHGVVTLDDAGLPGVFQYTGPASTVVNGSLWSLQAEDLSYILLLLLWVLLPSPGWVALLLAGMGLTILAYPPVLTWLPVIGYLLPYFAAGVLMWWLTPHLGTRRLLANLCAAGLMAGVLLGFPHQAFAAFGAYLVVFLGCRRSPIAGLLERSVDISYGLYLFGWPVQQVLRQMLDLHDPWVMFLLSALITAVLAWGLFHGVEKPAMALSQPISQWLSKRSADAS
jgi:peptidoglycan/LPS O-acetylase OafA/YrhL